MKATTRILAILFLVTAILALSAVTCFAYPNGWTSDATVVASGASTCDICSRGSDLWLAYRGNDSGTLKIYVRKSTDKAVTWQAPVLVETANSDSPQICATSTALYLAYWTDAGLKVKRSQDGGSTWPDYASVANNSVADFSMTHNGDAPAIAWEQSSNPGTGNPYHDSYYALLGAGGTLTGIRASHSDNENSAQNPTIASDGAGKYFIAFSTTDYVGQEDSGIWVTRVNGGTNWDHVYNGQYASDGYPDVEYRGVSGQFDLTYSHTAVGNTDNKVYLKSWTDAWGAEGLLYNAGSTIPYPKMSPLDSGNAVCRSADGQDIILATSSSTDPALMAGISAPAQPRSFAVNTETTSSEVYLAAVSPSGAVVVKRTDGVKPTSSSVAIAGGNAYNEGGQTVTYVKNATFTATYTLADDWNLTGTDPLGDQYTNGVSRIDTQWSSGDTGPWFDLPVPSGSATIDHAPWTITGASSDLSEGTVFVGGLIYDTASNTREIENQGSPALTPAKVVIDSTDPTINDATINPSGSGWHKTPITITLHGDDLYFLCNQYSLDSGAHWTNVANDTPFTLSQVDCVMRYRAVDKAGNVSEAKLADVHTDTTAPTASITKPTTDVICGNLSGYVYCSGNSYDTNLAGADLYADGVLISHADAGNPCGDWKVKDLADGSVHVIKIVATDKAGNTGTAERRVTIGSASAGSNWYFAEGTTREGFDEYLCVLNTDQKNAANLTFSFQLETGQTITKTATVPANSRATYHVNEMVPAGHDVSTRITSTGAAVIAERPMYFNYKGVWTGGHTAVGRNLLQTDFYFAEGTTRPGFDEWITLQNPNGSPATATVTYMLGTGKNKNKSYTVPATSRVTVNVNADVGPGQDVSAKVHSNQPIAAERPMYFSYNGWTGGHLVTGATAPQTTWYFAEGTTRAGFNEYLCLQNPNDIKAVVTVAYSTGQTKHYTVNSNSRYTVNVNNEVGGGKDVSATVTSDKPVVAERPMYFNYNGITGGHDTMGANETGSDFYFAEGTTRTGFNEYLTVLTPTTGSNDVVVYYTFGDGKTVTKTHAFFGGRGTINVNEDIGSGKDVSIRIIADPVVGNKFVVERPMYFNYRGWTGGSDVTGYSPY